jgi:hypothetical protein
VMGPWLRFCCQCHSADNNLICWTICSALYIHQIIILTLRFRWAVYYHIRDLRLNRLSSYCRPLDQEMARFAPVARRMVRDAARSTSAQGHTKGAPKVAPKIAPKSAVGSSSAADDFTEIDLPPQTETFRFNKSTPVQFLSTKHHPSVYVPKILNADEVDYSDYRKYFVEYFGSTGWTAAFNKSH